MATAVLGRSNGRVEFRLDQSRKSRYEEAANLKGKTLTQWTLANLDVAADRTFEEARATQLARDDFEERWSSKLLHVVWLRLDLRN